MTSAGECPVSAAEAASAARAITDAQVLGIDDAHLRQLPDGHRLHPLAANAFAALQREAAAAGFDLAIASSHRSFARQAAIWNGKLRGERPVHDDLGRTLCVASMTDEDKVAAVLRFSALPGTSRHHWGTDLDIFDAAALAPDTAVQLLPSEVCPGGPFDALHCWLDGRMAENRSCGFFRPYGLDRGGVAPERWHLSFAPVSRHLESRLSPQRLQRTWRDRDIACREVVERDLAGLLARYVAVPPDWAPGSDRRGSDPSGV